MIYQPTLITDRALIPSDISPKAKFRAYIDMDKAFHTTYKELTVMRSGAIEKRDADYVAHIGYALRELTAWRHYENDYINHGGYIYW